LTDPRRWKQLSHAQRDALVQAGVHPDQLYLDHTSGAKSSRPAWDALCKALRVGTNPHSPHRPTRWPDHRAGHRPDRRHRLHAPTGGPWPPAVAASHSHPHPADAARTPAITAIVWRSCSACSTPEAPSSPTTACSTSTPSTGSARSFDRGGVGAPQLTHDHVRMAREVIKEYPGIGPQDPDFSQGQRRKEVGQATDTSSTQPASSPRSTSPSWSRSTRKLNVLPVPTARLLPKPLLLSAVIEDAFTREGIRDGHRCHPGRAHPITR
jgi:hypothetical protein